MRPSVPLIVGVSLCALIGLGAAHNGQLNEPSYPGPYARSYSSAGGPTAGLRPNCLAVYSIVDTMGYGDTSQLSPTKTIQVPANETAWVYLGGWNISKTVFVDAGMKLMNDDPAYPQGYYTPLVRYKDANMSAYAEMTSPGVKVPPQREDGMWMRAEVKPAADPTKAYVLFSWSWPTVQGKPYNGGSMATPVLTGLSPSTGMTVHRTTQILQPSMATESMSTVGRYYDCRWRAMGVVDSTGASLNWGMPWKAIYHENNGGGYSIDLQQNWMWVPGPPPVKTTTTGGID